MERKNTLDLLQAGMSAQRPGILECATSDPEIIQQIAPMD